MLPVCLLAIAAVLVMFDGSKAAAVAEPEPFDDTPRTFDFEDVPARISGRPATSPIIDFYTEDGLRFPNGVTALIFDDTSVPRRADLARSGSQVITTCYSEEFCSNRIAMEFDRPLSELSLYAGARQPIREEAALVLQTFDEQGELLDTTALVFDESDEPLPADRLLRIDDRRGRIAAANLFWVGVGNRLGPGNLIVDDLTITPFVPPAQLSADPTKVELQVVDQAAQRVVSLTNNGERAVGPLVLAINPALPDEVQADLDCPRSLTPGATCEFVITVSPRPDGTEDADFGIEFFVGEEDGDDALAEIGLSLDLRPTPITTMTTTTTINGGDGQTTSNEDDDQTTTTLENREDPPDPGGFLIGMIVAGLVVAGLIRRWLRRRPAGPRPQPPNPPKPRPEPEPEPEPRPTVRVQAGEGTQTIEMTPTDRGRPISVVARLGATQGSVTISAHDDTDTMTPGTATPGTTTTPNTRGR